MHGKVALVTGAGSGIGRAAALALVREGWQVVLAGRRRLALEETARLAEGTTLVVPADVMSLSPRQFTTCLRPQKTPLAGSICCSTMPAAGLRRCRWTNCRWKPGGESSRSI